MKLTFFISAFSLLIGMSSSQASDICKAIALQDVHAIESPQAIVKRGDYDGSITQYRVDKKTGETSFCSHGGYCFPTHVMQGGEKREALRLVNCKIGKREPYDFPDEVIYAADVIRSKIAPVELRIDDVTRKLIEIGLCSACASNAAVVYVMKPASRCAQLTKKALEGDPIASKQLINDFFSNCPTAEPTKATNYPSQIIGAWGGRAAYFGDDDPTVAKKACGSYRKDANGVTGDVLVFRGAEKFSYGGSMDYVDTNVSIKQLAPDKWQITDRHYDDGEGSHRAGYKIVTYEVTVAGDILTIKESKYTSRFSRCVM